MSRMTFDELLDMLVNNRDELNNPDSPAKSFELIQEILNTGANILNRYPKNKQALLISLVQISTTFAALDDGDMFSAVLSESDKFQTALIYVVQACVGLMAMEEIR